MEKFHYKWKEDVCLTTVELNDGNVVIKCGYV